jgi:hypothetical protein
MTSEQVGAHPNQVTIPLDLAIDILDVLRMSPIYALMGSEYTHLLPRDFKSHKWEGHEPEHAEKALTSFRSLMQVVYPQAMGKELE